MPKLESVYNEMIFDTQLKCSYWWFENNFYFEINEGWWDERKRANS